MFDKYSYSVVSETSNGKDEIDMSICPSGMFRSCRIRKRRKIAKQAIVSYHIQINSDIDSYWI